MIFNYIIYLIVVFDALSRANNSEDGTYVSKHDSDGFCNSNTIYLSH